jgi:acyl carrier protein phosphodiesterase
LNYLAHLRLSPADPQLRLGNLLGDFVRGVDVSLLPSRVQEGIAQHRLLDRFTDGHPAFRRSRARLGPAFARLSGVLVDVYYDHFLARGWERWGDGRTLPAFASETYRLLDEHRHSLTPPLRAALPHMVAQDWLGSYAEVEAIDATLARMAARMSRPTSLAEGGRELRAHYEALQADFAEFFPAAMARAGAADQRRTDPAHWQA